MQYITTICSSFFICYLQISPVTHMWVTFQSWRNSDLLIYLFLAATFFLIYISNLYSDMYKTKSKGSKIKRISKVCY